MNFLINAAFDHLRMRRLSEGGVYYTFPFPNAAFTGGRRLKEEIRYVKFRKLLPRNQNFSVKIKVFWKLVTKATEKIQVTPFFYGLISANLVHRSSVYY